jgi:uncharacterized protein (DUF885 family)
MKYWSLIVVSTLAFTACKQPTGIPPNKELAAMLDQYYDDNLKFFPLQATVNGDNRYNDQLRVDFTNGFRDSLKIFYKKQLDAISAYKRQDLDTSDKISYDIFKREVEMNLEGLTFHDNYIPFSQFSGIPLMFGQGGSGQGFQPFKTVKDYDDWLGRINGFSNWSDSAIVYFKKGIATNFVLPKSLVIKMIPQMESMVTTDATKSLFYGPVTNMPKNFDTATSARIKAAYIKAINEKIIPAYNKLGMFLKSEYLPKARSSSGINSLPDGDNYYSYLVRLSTTTNKTPEEIHATGLSEVKRILQQMDSVKSAVGFKGDLPAFFDFMRTGKQFMPYKSPEEVLAAFERIYQTMKPNLAKMFLHIPKTKFEIRQTEAFRAASASAEYIQGTVDGSRPGIFYVPILDATKFNTTSGMESLFLHEAIPGHHYQISLQQEDTSLPKFRRFGGNNAYVEGWALYCESLGRELGLYTDPYQYMGALGDEMHRAIRLVVDVAIHTKNMSREEAIKYMMDNEAISEQGATAEIERYMAIPGQALGYKIGALKIRELRTKYEQQLGSKFNLAAFHDGILKDGAMPLEVLKTKMDEWAAAQK